VYIPDCAPYTDEYQSLPANTYATAVGWLQAGHPFTVAATDAPFVSALFEGCRSHATGRTRGWHQCDLCLAPDRATNGTTVTYRGTSITVGDAEFHVTAKDGTRFVAPTLVIHYVIQHSYKPPDQFVEAVTRGAFVGDQ